ncbi:hypothetical protein CCP2SC5_230032 [Azospirillaceae bacterium]
MCFGEEFYFLNIHAKIELRSLECYLKRLHYFIKKLLPQLKSIQNIIYYTGWAPCITIDAIVVWSERIQVASCRKI